MKFCTFLKPHPDKYLVSIGNHKAYSFVSAPPCFYMCILTIYLGLHMIAWTYSKCNFLYEVVSLSLSFFLFNWAVSCQCCVGDISYDKPVLNIYIPYLLIKIGWPSLSLSHKNAWLDFLFFSFAPCSRASDFGLMKVDKMGRIHQFLEKPKGENLRTMVYAFPLHKFFAFIF